MLQHKNWLDSCDSLGRRQSSMARFLLIILLATTSLLAIQARQLSHAGLSTAEVFWRTVLPDSPLPDSIRWLLHPDTNSESKGEVMKMDMAADHGAGRQSLNYPFFYFGYKGKTQTPMISDKYRAGRRFGNFFYVRYKGKSQKPADEDSHKETSATGTVVFFREEAVRGGETLPIYFPPAMRAPLGLLPRDVADSIPFATSALPDVIARFGIAAGSDQAADMEETLGMCETPSLAGEAKFCATSLEALVEGAMAALETRDIRPVTSTLPCSGAPLQSYTFRAVRPIDGSRFVACHDGNYPYTVYMCHDTGAVRAYKADMEGASGGAVTVTIVCHTDTSLWDPDHMSFKILGTKPGGEPVCHFMPYGHIMFAKNNATHFSA